MSTHEALKPSAAAMSFDAFWSWLALHPNCILRAGTPYGVVYDDDDFHWHFASEGQNLLVQVLRGKRLVGELLVDPEPITYVQGAEGDREGEYVFELIVENESEALSAYFFVMTHGFEAEEESDGGRAIH